MLIKLFDIQNSKVVPTEHCYTIKSLKKIMDKRLKQQNQDKIDNTFKKYGIKDKKSVNKEKINLILKEIMLN